MKNSNNEIVKGDWVFITSMRQIQQFHFDHTYGKRGIFGKVIDIIIRYNQFTGKKMEPVYVVRGYNKRNKRQKHSHYKTQKSRITKAFI